MFLSGLPPRADVLPCLEKHGKSCHMLLSQDNSYFIQTTEDADGMQVAARCANVGRPPPPSCSHHVYYKHLCNRGNSGLDSGQSLRCF